MLAIYLSRLPGHDIAALGSHAGSIFILKIFVSKKIIKFPGIGLLALINSDQILSWSSK